MIAAAAEHRVDAGFGVERARGPMGGVAVALRLGERWDLALHVMGGSLSAANSGAITRDVGEIGVSGGARVASWLTLSSGITRRVYGTTLARQSWTLVHAGAEVRVPFIGGTVQAIAGGAVLPVATVSGLPHPDVAFTATTGVEYRLGRTTLDLRYTLERYDFETSSGQRLEQLSRLALRARLGLASGR